eukprot:1976937-Pleurochrysis_carterae.AAC.8
MDARTDARTPPMDERTFARKHTSTHAPARTLTSANRTRYKLSQTYSERKGGTGVLSGEKEAVRGERGSARARRCARGAERRCGQGREWPMDRRTEQQVGKGGEGLV